VTNAGFCSVSRVIGRPPSLDQARSPPQESALVTDGHSLKYIAATKGFHLWPGGTPKEALLVTLNEKGRVDLERMGSLLNRPANEFLPGLLASPNERSV
jgi:hypothetical protein